MRLVAEASDTARGFKPLILPHHAPKSLFGTGARSARQAGSGEDFWQHRPYVFGDNAQNIDWRQSARSDDILIREQERLLPHRAYFSCDNSPAMQFNSRGTLPTKAFAAQRLLLALATLLMQGESTVRHLRAAQRQNVPELARAFMDEENDEFLSLPKLASRSFVIIASDFRQGPTEWKKIISEVSEMGAMGICIQMLDPIEDEFPLYGRVRLESAEDDSTIVIPGADVVRPIYLERLREQKNVMKDLCLQYNWQWISLSTDITPRKQLSQILQMLVRR